MRTEQAPELDPGMQGAARELQGIIRQHYPDAQFRLGRSADDPSIVHLITIVDVDDPDQVLDVVIDRQMELQIEEELPIFVVTERPWERAAALVRDHRSQGVVVVEDIPRRTT